MWSVALRSGSILPYSGQLNNSHPLPLAFRMLDVLLEDNHLLAVNKPPGIATMGEPEGTESMVTLAKQYLKQRYAKPGNVYLGVVSRLDKPVSGVLLFARTSKAATRLNRQFAAKSTRKTYWAIVTVDRPLLATGRLETWMRKNESQRRMEVCAAEAPHAQQALLAYRVLHQTRQIAWLQIDLETGRKHQIRVQLAELGCPVLGDMKYGSRQAFRAGIALHSRRLQLEHPVRHEPLDLQADLPPAWPPPPF